jgi:DegV family protein with EDD domain
MAVVVVTDSSSSILPAVGRFYGIAVAPVHVLAGDRDYLEGIDAVPDDAGRATTAAPSRGELSDLYGRALAESGGDGVLAMHLSPHLSGTWNNAKAAAEAFGDKVRVIESTGVAMALGFPVLEAARLASTGAPLDELEPRAAAHLKASMGYAAVGGLEQLRKGGRIGTAAALLGTALAMKPVIALDEGKLILLEKTRTTSRALAKLLERATEAAGGKRIRVAVQHVGAVEEARSVAAALRTALPNLAELLVVELSAVLATHVGKGTVAVLLSPVPEDENPGTRDNP